MSRTKKPCPYSSSSLRAAVVFHESLPRGRDSDRHAMGDDFRPVCKLQCAQRPKHVGSRRVRSRLDAARRQPVFSFVCNCL